MKHIGSQLKKAIKKTKDTERGELMEYFCAELNRSRLRDGLAPLSMPRMGRILQGIPTKDLYYLKRVCDDSQNFSKKFWYEIKAEKHTPEAKAQQAKLFAQRDRERRFGKER